MSANDASLLAALRAEVDALRAAHEAVRAELAAMRAELAREIRTQGLVVDDGGGRETTIRPGVVSVSCEDAATIAGMSADWEEANVHAYSSLAVFTLWPEGEPEPEHHAAQLVATSPLGGPRAARLEVGNDHQKATIAPGQVHLHETLGDVHAVLEVDQGHAAVSLVDNTDDGTHASSTATLAVSSSDSASAPSAMLDLNDHVTRHDAEHWAADVS